MSVTSQWLQMWRVDHIELASPLPVEVAEARLAAGVTTRGQLGRHNPTDPAARVIVGRVAHRRVRLAATLLSAVHAWKPVLRGLLEPTADGCRLVGTVGWLPRVRVFTLVELGFAVGSLLLGAVGVVASLTSGKDVGPFAGLLTVGAVCSVGGLLVVGFFGAIGREDGRHLRTWLAATLRSPDITVDISEVEQNSRP